MGSDGSTICKIIDSSIDRYQVVLVVVLLVALVTILVVVLIVLEVV